MTKDIKQAAWIDNSGHPKHVLYCQSATERKLYGPLQPLYGQAALDAAVAAERERCAKLLEDQRYMTLEPLRTYTADEVVQRVRSSVTHLAAMIRRA